MARSIEVYFWVVTNGTPYTFFMNCTNYCSGYFVVYMLYNTLIHHEWDQLVSRGRLHSPDGMGDLRILFWSASRRTKKEKKWFQTVFQTVLVFSPTVFFHQQQVLRQQIKWNVNSRSVDRKAFVNWKPGL